MKLALGTAQFGMPYGITNTQGQVSLGEMEQVLYQARQVGIDTLDTAVCYGSAESRIGTLLAGEPIFNIITKLPAGIKPKGVEAAFDASLKRLKVDRIAAILIHSVDDLLGPSGDQLAEVLMRLPCQIGVSIYHPYELQVLTERYDLRCYQVPLNLLDQRFLVSEIEHFIQNHGCRLLGRSLFLQGILLSPLDRLPSYFLSFLSSLKKVHELAQSLCVSPLVLAMALVHRVPMFDRIVVGCCDLNEFNQQIESYYLAESLAASVDINALAFHEESLILPGRWTETEYGV